MLNGKKRVRQWRKQKKETIVITICFILLCFQFIKLQPQNLMISFLDVAQGDCTLIKTPRHKTVIIDGGGSRDMEKYDVGKKVVLPYLLSHHIKQIDVMIISHFDADHCNGLIAVLENIKVKKLIIGMQNEESEEYKNIMNIVRKKKIQVEIVKENAKLVIDSEVYFDVIYPGKEDLKGKNNNSLVLKLNYGKFNALFTGDIEKEAESKILDKYQKDSRLRAIVLKIAHHGSKTSTTEEFLNKVKPQIALIGVGENNHFGHPNKEIIGRLESKKIQIYRTDLQGEIRLQIDKAGKIKIRKKIK